MDGMFVQEPSGGGATYYREVSAVTSNNSNITAAVGILYTVTLNDQTITLPAAASYAGKMIGFKVVAVSGSKICTLDGNASETIDGATTLVLYVLNDMVEIISDGTNWQIVGDGRIPHTAKLRRDAAQSIADSTLTKILFDAEEYDVGGIGDQVTNNRIDIRRAGKYRITATVGLSSMSDGNVVIPYIRRNASEIRRNSFSLVGGSYLLQSIIPTFGTDYSLSAGDYIDLGVYQVNSGATSLNTDTTSSIRPELVVTEIR